MSTEIEWRKSEFCGSSACVEVATKPNGNIGVRNSTQPYKVLDFTPDEWAAFVAGVKAGNFD